MFVFLRTETVGREMPDSKPFITPMVFLCFYRSDAVLDFHFCFLFHSHCKFSGPNTNKRAFHDNHLIKNTLIVYARLYGGWLANLTSAFQYYIKLKHCQC